MVKYYLKNGDEVVPGDCINVRLTVDTPFGKKKVIFEVTIDEKSLEFLKEGGYITFEEEINVNTLPFVKEFIISSGIPIDTAVDIINSSIENGDYIVALYLLLKAASSLDRDDTLVNNKGKSCIIFNFHTGKPEWVTKPGPCDIVFSDEEAAITIVNRLSSLIKVAYGRK